MVVAKVDDLGNFCRLFLEILEDPFLATDDSKTSKRTRLVAALTAKVGEAVAEALAEEYRIAERNLAAVDWSKHSHLCKDDKEKIVTEYSTADRIDQHHNPAVGQIQVLVAEIEIDYSYLCCR